MSLRTRLIIAFLLLSVVPLSAMTFISYRSSITTFENAARREASQSAVDIGRRMERITADVGRRMDRMFVTVPPSASDRPETGHRRARRASRRCSAKPPHWSSGSSSIRRSRPAGTPPSRLSRRHHGSAPTAGRASRHPGASSAAEDEGAAAGVAAWTRWSRRLPRRRPR